MTQPIVLPPMTEQQQAAFYASYRAVERDEVVGVLLAVLLGGFGAHYFYLRRPGTGVLYLLFSWTGLTYFIAWVEAFFMPRRVRQFNQEMAAYIAAAVTAAGTQGASGSSQTMFPAIVCPSCGNSTVSSARFCGRCGARLHPEGETTSVSLV